MSWEAYLIISILLLSCNGLFHRSLLKDDDSSPLAQTIIFLGIGGILAIIIAVFRGNLNLHIPSSLFWNFILLAAILTPAYILKYKAFQHIGVSEVVMFSATGRLWNVIGAHFFLNETVTIKMILGAIIILAGVAITRFENRKITFNKGVVFVLISAFLFGMGDVNGFFILRSFDSANFLIYATILPVITLLIIKPATIKKLKYYFKKDRAFKITLLCVFDTLGMLSLYRAYQVGQNAAVIGPLRATSIIVTVVLAAIFLKERENLKNKLLGAFVSVVGVYLLL